MVFKKALIFWAQLNVILNLNFPVCLFVEHCEHKHAHTLLLYKLYLITREQNQKAQLPAYNLLPFLSRGMEHDVIK